MEDKYYKDIFAKISIEQKRKDLEQHPFINHDKIKLATDEEIEEVYFNVYSSMDKAMRETIGESMYEDDYV